MDAFAVSVSNGISIKAMNYGLAMKIALFFGSFQAVMPVLGWMLGLTLRDLLFAFSNYMAFIILFILGIKMIYEAYKKEEKSCNCESLNILILYSFATSIDAFAVGFSFSMLNISIIRPVIIIGIITFFMSLTGIYIGKQIGHFFENKIEIFGGMILILTSFKILAGY